MKCRTCDYPLWNIAPGPCPECGSVFDPSEFEFPVGRVRFCCPHCDQAYFGDGDGGHLVPSAFECVGCGRSIDESECTVRPVEGYDEADLEVASVPWFDQRRGRFRRFVDTIGWSMSRPGQLGARMPANGALLGGLMFMVRIHILIFFLGFFPFVLLMILAAGIGGGFGQTTLMLVSFSMLSVVLATGSILSLALQGAIAHVVLRVTGPVRHPFQTTIGTVFFASGPLAISMVPFVGPVCLNTIGIIWGIVAGIFALQKSQGVGAGRAALATLTAPVVGVALYFGFIMFMSFANLAAGPVPRPIPLAVNTNAEVVIGDQLATPDTSLLAVEVAEAPRLPGTAAVLRAGGFVFQDSTSVNLRSPLPQPTTIKGLGFDGWCIPGLLVVKAADSAIVSVVTRTSGSSGPDGFVVETEARISSTDGISQSVVMAGRTSELSDAYDDLVDFIDDAGGRGLTLDPVVFAAWWSESMAARLVYEQAVAGRKVDDPPSAISDEPDAAGPDQSPPSPSPEDADE